MADPPTDYSTSPEVPQSPSFTSSSSTSVPSSPPPPSSLTTTAGDALKAEDSPLEDIDLDRSPVIPQAEREDVDDTTSFPPKPSRPTTTTTPSTRFNAVDASSLPPTPPPKPSPPPLHSTSTPMARVPSQTPAVVHAVLLVSFDHALGPIVEFAHPPVFRDNEELNKNLPFLALPDGAHLVRRLAQTGSQCKGTRARAASSREALPSPVDRARFGPVRWMGQTHLEGVASR